MTKRNFGFRAPPQAPAAPGLPLLLIGAILVIILALAVSHA